MDTRDAMAHLRALVENYGVAHDEMALYTVEVALLPTTTSSPPPTSGKVPVRVEPVLDDAEVCQLQDQIRKFGETVTSGIVCKAILTLAAAVDALRGAGEV
jgi:hypothetical protein